MVLSLYWTTVISYTNYTTIKIIAWFDDNCFALIISMRLDCNCKARKRRRERERERIYAKRNSQFRMFYIVWLGRGADKIIK